MRVLFGAAAAVAILSGVSPGLAAPGAEKQSVPLLPSSSDADARRRDEIIVVGDRVTLLSIPGSGAVIDEEDLRRSRVFSVNEALRQAPGLFPREEEGAGLRPNIGVRGLSPIRSTKVLLLEDGLPLSFAPYGDNASYYHPPIRRFSRIETLLGASQIRFGPQTVGGVVNYITPAAPEEFGGRIMLAGGNRDYREIDATAGGPILGARVLFHANATRSDGARDNQALRFSDYYAKIERDFGEDHSLTLRLSRFAEDSDVTYSGLTEAEFAANPRGNPFTNDEFITERWGASATHGWSLSDAVTLKTSAYYAYFDRDWWRQSSNSGQRPNDASDPNCGGMANLDTTCGNEGRLREYHTYGIETRLGADFTALGADVSVEAGVRVHAERQRRLQVNADSPRGRTPGVSVNGGIREDNIRRALATSGFATANIDFGRLSISPGVRVEHVEYERENRLVPIAGATDLTEVIPGVGATFELTDRVAIFAGVHRGFAPPRVEDIISNSTGGVAEIDAEESLNYELGLRGRLREGVDFDLVGYRLDFDNQVIPASVAGGVGATLTSAGKTRHIGAELGLRGSARDMGLLERDDLYVRAAATWIAEAEFRGARFSGVPGFSTTPVTGNRLPYAPEWLVSAAIGYNWREIVTGQIEIVHTGKQFTDDLNTIAPTANGQRGLIPSATIFNAAINVTPPKSPVTFFVTVKNLADELYIADRARGVLPGLPRLVQAGVEFAF